MKKTNESILQMIDDQVTAGAKTTEQIRVKLDAMSIQQQLTVLLIALVIVLLFIR